MQDLLEGGALARALAAGAQRRETPCGAGRLVWQDWGVARAGQRTLVLLHGGSGSWRHWARTLPAVRPRGRVLAPDLPGLGDSDLPPSGSGLWDLAAILAEGLERLLEPGEACDLVGFSFGAVLSGHLAARHAGRFRSLTLVGAGALGLQRHPVTLERVRDKQGAARMAAHRANLERLMFADPARIDAETLAIQAWNSDHARLRSRDIASTTALRDALAASRLPLQAIYGERDAIVFPFMQERVEFFASLPRAAPLQVVPGAGHWVAQEAPEAFNRLLLARLAAA